MTPETLARAGRLLAGTDEWQSTLARMLGPHHPLGSRETVDPRLVRRWAAGERPVADWVPGALAGLLHRRADVLHQEAQLAAALADEFAT